MWVRTTRITLLVAFLIAIAVLSYLASHPHLYSGHVGRLITRNLLRDTGVTFAFRDLRGNPLEAMRFYDVSLTQRGDDGSFSYVTCDSLEIAYDLRALLGREARLSRLVAHDVEVLVRRGAREETRPRLSRSRPIGRVPLTIAVAEIRGASVLVTSPEGESEEVIDDLVWLGSVHQEDDALQVETNVLHAAWPSRDTTIHAASGHLAVGDERVEIVDFHAELDSSDVELRGWVDPPRDGRDVAVDIEAEARPARLDDILNLLDLGTGPFLVHRGRLRVRYDGDVRIDGAGEGRLEHFPYTAREVGITVRGDDLRFERILCTFQGVEGDLHGAVDLETEVVSLQGHGKHMDLSRPWTGEDRGWPQSDLEADFALRLDLRDPEDVQLRLGLARGSGRIFDLPLDSLSVDLRYSPRQGVVIERSRLLCQGTWLKSAGAVDASNEVAIDVEATAAQVDPWLARLGLRMQGQDLTVAGRLSGTTEQTKLRVGGRVDRLTGYGFVGLDNHVMLQVESILSDWHELQGEVLVGSLSARGRLLGTLRTQVERSGPRVEVPRLELAVGDTTLVGTGGVIRNGSTTTVEVESMELSAGEQTWGLNEPTSVDVFEHGFSTPGMTITSSTGSFHLEGGFQRDGRADLRLSVEDGDLGLLGRMALAPADLAGHIDATVTFGGSTDAPVGDVNLALKDARLAGRSLDEAELRLRAEGTMLSLEELRASGPHGRVDISGRGRMDRRSWLRDGLNDPGVWSTLLENVDLDLDLAVADADLDAWLLLNDRDRRLGRAGGRLSIAGPALAPLVSGEVSLEGFESGPLSLPRVEATVQADGQGLRVVEGLILAPEPWLTVSGRFPVFVSAARKPRWEPQRDLELELRSVGEVDLRPVGEMFPFFTRLEGTAELVYRASGPLDAPRLEGRLRIQDGVAQMAGTLEVFREIVSEAQFAQNVLRVNRFEAREGENGRLEAVGEVAFRGLLPDDVWFDITAHRILLVSVPLLRAIATSDDLKLRLERPLPGGPRIPKVTGSLLVDKAIYTGDFSEGASQGPTVLAPTATPDWLAELRIRAQDQVRISNAALELRLQGDMDFVRDLSGARYRGRVEIPQGRVRVLYQDFTITQGLLDFSQSTGFEPVMDIVAETEVPVYDPNTGIGRELERVTVYLTGTLHEPVIRFTSESGYNDDTILRLLVGLGPESSDQGVALGDIGYRVGVNYLGQALASQVGGVDTIDIETQEAGLEDLGSTRIAVGKYLSNNIYLRFSQGFTITERDLFLEYQISRRMLFNTEVRRRLRENAAYTQFNVNLKFRIEY